MFYNFKNDTILVKQYIIIYIFLYIFIAYYFFPKKNIFMIETHFQLLLLSHLNFQLFLINLQNQTHNLPNHIPHFIFIYISFKLNFFSLEEFKLFVKIY